MYLYKSVAFKSLITHMHLITSVCVSVSFFLSLVPRNIINSKINRSIKFFTLLFTCIIKSLFRFFHFYFSVVFTSFLFNELFCLLNSTL